MTEKAKTGLQARIKAEESKPKEIKKSTREATIRLNVPLEPLFHARLKSRAALHYMTIEQVVKEALTQWMKDHPEPTD